MKLIQLYEAYYTWMFKALQKMFMGTYMWGTLVNHKIEDRLHKKD